jgi:uncharacterized protein (TIGR02996 family)
MAVYFVYRCHYGTPSEKHVRRFEYDTVLEWAQGVFRQLPSDEAFEYAEKLLGGLHVYSFGSLFRIDDNHPPRECPRTMEDVSAWFSDMYDQGQANGPHHIQLLTDDDELEMAVYVFDDHYRAAHPGKADFLLLDGWELPAGDSDAPPPALPETSPYDKPGDGAGAVYTLSLFADDSCNLSDLSPPGRIDGLRLDGLARHLLLHPDEDGLGYGLMETGEALRAVIDNPTGDDAGFLAAIRDQPAELTHWAVYSDWLAERDLPPAGIHLLDRALRANELGGGRKNRNPALDLAKTTAHAAQVCRHEGRWPDEPFLWFSPNDQFAQIIFFDDRWAAAHPTLAAGLITFASRWDVLTDGPRTDV